MGSIEDALTDAKDLAHCFVQAAISKDTFAGRALCSDAGWQDGANPLQGLFRTIGAKGLGVDLLAEPRKFGDRAAQWAVLSHPSRPKPLGDLWLLLQRVEGYWQLVGATKLRPVVGLYLWGEVPGALSITDLDRSSVAEAWAAPLEAALREGRVPELPHGSELLTRRLSVDGVQIKALRSVELTAAERAAVGFLFTTVDDAVGYDVWLVLDIRDGASTVIGSMEFLGLEGLLRGIDRDWPHEDPDHEGRALSDAENATDPAMGRRVMEAFFGRLLQARNIDPDALAQDDPLAGQIADFLGALRSMAPKPGEDEADRRSLRGAAEPTVLTLPPEIEAAVADVVQRLRAENALGPGEVRAADALLEQHGGELVAGLLGGLLRQVAPGELTLNLPVEGDEGEVVQLTLDPQALLTKAMASPNHANDAKRGEPPTD